MKDRSNLSAELTAELAALDALPDDQIDLSDMPEATDLRGLGYVDFERPGKDVRPVWIERELIDWFIAHGNADEPVAKRVNQALRDHVIRTVRKAA